MDEIKIAIRALLLRLKSFEKPDDSFLDFLIILLTRVHDMLEKGSFHILIQLFMLLKDTSPEEDALLAEYEQLCSFLMQKLYLACDITQPKMDPTKDWILASLALIREEFKELNQVVEQSIDPRLLLVKSNIVSYLADISYFFHLQHCLRMHNIKNCTLVSVVKISDKMCQMITANSKKAKESQVDISLELEKLLLLLGELKEPAAFYIKFMQDNPKYQYWVTIEECHTLLNKLHTIINYLQENNANGQKLTTLVTATRQLQQGLKASSEKLLQERQESASWFEKIQVPLQSIKNNCQKAMNSKHATSNSFLLSKEAIYTRSFLTRICVQGDEVAGFRKFMLIYPSVICNHEDPWIVLCHQITIDAVNTYKALLIKTYDDLIKREHPLKVMFDKTLQHSNKLLPLEEGVKKRIQELFASPTGLTFVQGTVPAAAMSSK